MDTEQILTVNFEPLPPPPLSFHTYSVFVFGNAFDLYSEGARFESLYVRLSRAFGGCFTELYSTVQYSGTVTEITPPY
jgi:hypothetical protein